MYNIKQAAARAGVSVPVLRAWERRYGIVRPIRTASNYRQFDDESIARIQTMRSLVEAGWAPSAAAAALLAGDVPELPTATGPGGAASEHDADVALGDAFRDHLAEQLVRAAAELDAAALDATLDELFASGSFERVTTHLLFPALERLGNAWASGELSVAGEHLASAAVHRRLALALEAAGAPLPGRPIIVGLPPGGRHELGALAFAVTARRAGLPVAYLGADLPIDDWASASESAAAAVIGVVMARDRGPARRVAARLHGGRPSLFVGVGGRAARDGDGVELLPANLTAAVKTIRDHLSRGNQPRAAAS